MFDIGFSELFVIGVVALIVIGPERLPKVARTVGHMMGRLQRYVNDVKADINREMELDELRKFKQEVESTAASFESSVREEATKVQSAFDETAKAFGDVAQSISGPPPGTPEATPPAGAPALGTGSAPAGGTGPSTAAPSGTPPTGSAALPEHR
jgi:sec-independent protein translocase protein TatB